MDKELGKCIERRKIIKFSKARTLTGKELKLALEDLKCAKESFLNKNYRWTTIQSYYSMFHSARALLYKKGYREKSHFCLIEAVREFYVMGGKLNFKFIEALMLGKSLRENADYYGDFDEHSSNEMMEMAGKFFKEAKRILQEN